MKKSFTGQRTTLRLIAKTPRRKGAKARRRKTGVTDDQFNKALGIFQEFGPRRRIPVHERLAEVFHTATVEDFQAWQAWWTRKQRFARFQSGFPDAQSLAGSPLLRRYTAIVSRSGRSGWFWRVMSRAMSKSLPHYRKERYWTSIQSRKTTLARTRFFEASAYSLGDKTTMKILKGLKLSLWHWLSDRVLFNNGVRERLCRQEFFF
jgi:hypothetical protein